MEPELWFYADRQLIPSITTPAAFEKAMKEPYYLLPFSYTQSGGPRPSWFVMPLCDREKYSDLTAALDVRFPKERREPFDLYDLTKHAP
jgi:hypothetical protein